MKTQNSTDATTIVGMGFGVLGLVSAISLSPVFAAVGVAIGVAIVGGIWGVAKIAG